MATAAEIEHQARQLAASGKLAEALEHLNQGATALRVELGMYHPHLLSLLITAGELSLLCGHLPQAIRYFLRARSRIVYAYGDSHALLARVLCALGQAYQKQGLHPEGVGCFRHAVAISEQLPDLEFTFAPVLVALSEDAEARAQGDEARAYLLRAVELLEKKSDAASNDSIQKLRLKLGHLCYQAGDENAAVSHFTFALKDWERLRVSSAEQLSKALEVLLAHAEQEEDHESQLMLLSRLIELAEMQKDDAGAGIELLRRRAALYARHDLADQALADYRRILTNNNENILRPQQRGETELAIAELCFLSQRPAEAECALVNASEIFNTDNVNPELGAFALHNLGSIRLQQGNFSEALPALKHALTIREQILGAEHVQTAETLGAIGALYRETKNWGTACAYLSRAVAMRSALLGADHDLVKQTKMALDTCTKELEQASPDPTSGAVVEGASIALLEQASQNVAEQQTQAALAEKFGNATLLIDGEQCFEGLELLQEILAVLEGMKSDPASLRPVLSEIARGYEKMGFLPQARAFKERALACDA